MRCVPAGGLAPDSSSLAPLSGSSLAAGAHLLVLFHLGNTVCALRLLHDVKHNKWCWGALGCPHQMCPLS